MKATVPIELEACREVDGFYGTSSADGFNGRFHLPGGMIVICSDGAGWDHVSVSFPDRTPNWDEMCMVKRLCWDNTEWVCQFHPSSDDYVNCHPHCLHLWKPQRAEMPKPEAWMVGPRNAQAVVQ